MKAFLFFHRFGSFIGFFVFTCAILSMNTDGVLHVLFATLTIGVMMGTSVVNYYALIKISRLSQVTILGARIKRFWRNLLLTSLAVLFVVFFLTTKPSDDFVLTMIFDVYWIFLVIAVIYIVESVLPLSRWTAVLVGSVMITKDKREFKLSADSAIEMLSRDSALLTLGDKSTRLWITPKDVEKLQLIIDQLKTIDNDE